MFPDIFNDDAFSLDTLTATINNFDFVPGRAGALAFAGVQEGVATLTVAIEQVGESLSLIQTTGRGAPAPKETQDKAVLRSISIPQVKLEDTIGAAQLQNVRAFGSTNTLRGPRTVIDQQMLKMTRRHDMTLENLRLGALRGLIKDADGSTLYNLFTEFGVSAPSDVDFSAAFASFDPTDPTDTIRGLAQDVTRTIWRNLKAPKPASANIWAFCGDNFFDTLIESTKDTWNGWEQAERRLGGNYAWGIYEYGGIFWENYQGTDDGSTVAIASDTCQFFPVGVPGLYAQYNAPADFMETVNTLGLPRYAKIAPDPKFNRFVELHTQQNPLPLCLRPKVLIKGTM